MFSTPPLLRASTGRCGRPRGQKCREGRTSENTHRRHPEHVDVLSNTPPLSKTQQARCVCGPIPSLRLSHPTSSSPGSGEKKKKRKRCKVHEKPRLMFHLQTKDLRMASWCAMKEVNARPSRAHSHIHNTHTHTENPGVC